MRRSRNQSNKQKPLLATTRPFLIIFCRRLSYKLSLTGSLLLPTLTFLGELPILSSPRAKPSRCLEQTPRQCRIVENASTTHRLPLRKKRAWRRKRNWKWRDCARCRSVPQMLRPSRMSFEQSGTRKPATGQRGRRLKQQRNRRQR